jgi:hypothetical protein
MTDETTETETTKITVSLDAARAVMYAELLELDEQLINQTIARELAVVLTELYDNRHEIAAETEAPTNSQTDN